jgi:hypothetical protein
MTCYGGPRGYKLFYSERIEGFRMLLIFALMPVYFWLRTWFINRMKYDGKRHSPAGFKAGLCAVILYFGLCYFPLGFFDYICESDDLDALMLKHKDIIMDLQREEGRFVNALSQKPKSAQDMKYYAVLIDKYLEFAKQKYDVQRSIFSDLMAIRSREGERGKAKGEVLWELQWKLVPLCEARVKAYEALKEYYLTGDKTLYNKYAGLQEEADRCSEPSKSRMPDRVLYE